MSDPNTRGQAMWAGLIKHAGNTVMAYIRVRFLLGGRLWLARIIVQQDRTRGQIDATLQRLDGEHGGDFGIPQYGAQTRRWFIRVKRHEGCTDFENRQ